MEMIHQREKADGAEGKKIHARVRALHANREQASVLCGYNAGKLAGLA